jgi:predicted phosphate transport protein (TIGR00153 family)
MRIPILSMFMFSPFDGLEEHAEKVREAAAIFRDGIKYRLENDCNSFELARHEVGRLENEADMVKRRIRGHLPKGTLMVVDKFQLFSYLKEQDNVIDAFQHVLDWLSFRKGDSVPPYFRGDINFLVDCVLTPVDRLKKMVTDAQRYFKTFSNEDRSIVKGHIRELRKQEGRADILEATLKHDIFEKESDAVTIFHLIRLVEMLGEIADCVENAGDRMRAMIAR